MSQLNVEGAKDKELGKLSQRELLVAYLSYALNDVRKHSGIGSQLLQMTIAAIAEGPASDISNSATRSDLPH